MTFLVPLISFKSFETVNDQTSMAAFTYYPQKSVSNGRLNGEGKVINSGVGKMQVQATAKGKD